MDLILRFLARFLSLVCVLFAFSFLAACGGNAGSSETEALRTVQGTRQITYVTDAGTQTVPDDTTKFVIAALVPTGSGGYTTIPGTGSPTGSFTIPNVPGGNYLLQSGCCTFIATSSSALDTGYSQVGRSNRQLPTQPPSITFSLTNTSPLHSTDALQVSTSNTGSEMFWLLEDFVNPPPGWAPPLPVGSTSFSPTVPWTGYLNNASQGDAAYITELVSQSGGFPLVSLQKASGPLIYTLTDGTPATLSTTTLADVPRSQSAHLAFKGSAFAALASGINPQATASDTDIYFSVSPADVSLGYIGGAPALIASNNPGSPITTDVDFGAVSYGNPFSSSWQPFVRAYQYVEMGYPVAGSAVPLGARGTVHVSLAASQSAAIAPLVGPVANPTINNQNFFANQSGVGTTPTLSWNPPQFGTATGYRIYVNLLYVNSQQQPAGETVAEFYTAGTSLTLPSNILLAGNSYSIVITALYNPTMDITQSPFRVSIPFGQADALSGVFTP